MSLRSRNHSGGLEASIENFLRLGDGNSDSEGAEHDVRDAEEQYRKTLAALTALDSNINMSYGGMETSFIGDVTVALRILAQLAPEVDCDE